MARCPSGGRLEFVIAIQEDKTSISPQTCGELDGKVLSSHTGKMAKKLSTRKKNSPGHLAFTQSLPTPVQGAKGERTPLYNEVCCVLSRVLKHLTR